MMITPVTALTDDLQSRLSSWQGDVLVGWTPEIIAARMIEAADVFTRTPMRIMPARVKTAWPQFVRVAEDLIDETTKDRVLKYRRFDGDWSRYVDDSTKRHLSREKSIEFARAQPPSADAYSRAEEALRWPSLYLASSPLLADALTVWVLCVATGASLRATCRERRKQAKRIAAAEFPKNLYHQNIAVRRIAGCAMISDALNAAGVAVRAAPEEIEIGDGG